MGGQSKWEYEPDTASAVNAMAELFQEHFGGTWGAWHAGNFIPGERVAGWAGFEPDENGRPVLVGVVMYGEAITADLMRKVPIAALENTVNLTNRVSREQLEDELKSLPPLKREPDMTPEAFSQLVADHFRAWAKAVPHPAAAMAAEAEVKPPTVHGWIREARLRGLLPPAKRKKGRGNAS